jgi:C-terminal peptidase prc
VEFAHVARVPFVALDTRKLGDDVTYIRLGTFEHAKAVDMALGALDKAGRGGVVLDLRINGGGYVDQQQRLLDRLLPANLLVGRRIGVGGVSESRTGAGVKYTGPLVVLIGPGTGSAAECLAAALQDHGRARLLGRSTAGAVLTARVWPLPGGGTVAVAYLEYVRSNGQRIEGIGVMPDVPIMPTNADARAGRDPALERALRELRDARLSATAGPPPPG